MERYCSTGQSPQRAVAPTEEEEDEEEEEEEEEEGEGEEEGPVHCNNILIYIQQDATLHSLFYLETALHVSGGTSTHHQEDIHLQHLVFFTPFLPLAADSNNGVT
jgi:hypothetical protein